MTEKRRMLLIGVLIAFVVMLVFPPYGYSLLNGESFKTFGFLLKPSQYTTHFGGGTSNTYSLLWGQLLIQYAVLAVVSTLLWFILGDTKKEESKPEEKKEEAQPEEKKEETPAEKKAK